MFIFYIPNFLGPPLDASESGEEHRDNSVVKRPSLTHLLRFLFLAGIFTMYGGDFLLCVQACFSLLVLKFDSASIESILYPLVTLAIKQKKKEKKACEGGRK